jgi:hypothetical protein
MEGCGCSFMEKPEKLKVKSKKRKKSKEKALWNKILLKDLELSNLQLYQESLQSEMIHQTFELEKKRNFKDYVR